MLEEVRIRKGRTMPSECRKRKQGWRFSSEFGWLVRRDPGDGRAATKIVSTEFNAARLQAKQSQDARLCFRKKRNDSLSFAVERHAGTQHGNGTAVYGRDC